MMKIDALPTLFRTAPWRLRLLHSAPYLRLVWITGGQARCIIGARMRGIGVHSLLVVPQNAPFSLTPGAALSGLMVCLPEPPAGVWPEDAMLLRIRDTFQHSEVGGLLDAIQREQSAARPLYEDAMQAYVPLLSIWLSRQLETDAFTPPPETASDLVANAYLANLEAHYRRGETVATYAKRLGLTPTHLSRVCKAQLGASASELAAERVLWAARDLLETTRLPAKQIAQALGFSSGATFTRFIQAHLAKPPLAVRKAAAPPHPARSARM